MPIILGTNDKGELHRLDGPALMWIDGRKEWWVEGKKISEQEFNLLFLLRKD